MLNSPANFVAYEGYKQRCDRGWQLCIKLFILGFGNQSRCVYILGNNNYVRKWIYPGIVYKGGRKPLVVEKNIFHLLKLMKKVLFPQLVVSSLLYTQTMIDPLYLLGCSIATIFNSNVMQLLNILSPNKGFCCKHESTICLDLFWINAI